MSAYDPYNRPIQDGEPDGYTYVQDEFVTDDEESPAEIRARIERTRAEMSQTIDAIQERLNPTHIAEQVRDTVREATIGRAEQMVNEVTDSARDMSSNIVDTVIRNPVPAALVGIGLTWLYMQGSQSHASRRSSRQQYASNQQYTSNYGRSGARSYGGRTAYNEFDYGRPGYAPDYTAGRYAQSYRAGPPSEGWSDMAEDAQHRVGQAVGQAQHQVGRVVDKAQHRVGELVEGAQETVTGVASEVAHTVSEYADQARHTVGEYAEDISETARTYAQEARMQAQDLSHQAYYQAEWAADRFGEMLEESPMAVGAIAMALGAAVGLAVPITRQEEYYMGEARDTLIHKAQEVAQEAAEKVQHVAERAQQVVQQEIKDQGLVDRVESIAEEAKHAVKQEAQKQGLTEPATTAGAPRPGQPAAQPAGQMAGATAGGAPRPGQPAPASPQPQGAKPQGQAQNQGATPASRPNQPNQPQNQGQGQGQGQTGGTSGGGSTQRPGQSNTPNQGGGNRNP